MQEDLLLCSATFKNADKLRNFDVMNVKFVL
jgi:hypothetical protein